jgi:hypothetical protein
MERHGDPRFYALLEEIAELHSRKNHDYSKANEPLSNFRKCEAFGVSAFRGVLVRMSDKWSRIEQLTSGKEAKNESLRDSLIDNAVYSLLAVLLREDELPKPRSFDDARAEPLPCKCGKLVTRPEQCPGLPCPFPKPQGDGAEEPFDSGPTGRDGA